MIRLNISDHDENNDLEILTSTTNNSGMLLDDLFKDEHTPNNDRPKSSLFYKPRQQQYANDIDSGVKSSIVPSQKALQLKYASAVEVYQFDNEIYNYIGKYGIAFLGDDQIFCYQIIIYTGKQKLICLVKITDGFRLMCQANNYVNFYDETLRNWSVMFNDDEDRLRFVRQVVHSLFNIKCKEKKNQFIIQNIDPVADKNKILLKNKTIQYRFTLHGHRDEEVKLILDNVIKTYTFGNGQMEQTLMDILPTPASSKHKFIIYSPNKCIEMPSIEKIFSPQVSDVYDKLSIEIWFEQFIEKEKEKTLTETVPLKDVQLESNQETSKIDLASKMAKIGGLLLPIHSNPEAKISEKKIEITKANEIKSDNVMPIEEDKFHKFELLLEQMSNNLNEVKQKLKAPALPSNTNRNLLLDSEIILLNIQQLFDENNRLKMEVEQKRNEIETSKIKQAKSSSSTDQDSTTMHSNVDVENLRENIYDFKEKLDQLRKENHRLSMLSFKFEKLSLEMSRKVESLNYMLINSNDNSKQMLKQCLNYIYSKFNTELSETKMIDNDELIQNICQLLATVMIEAKQTFLDSSNENKMVK